MSSPATYDSNGFHMYLSSVDSVDYFPSNTSDKFIVKLPEVTQQTKPYSLSITTFLSGTKKSAASEYLSSQLTVNLSHSEKKHSTAHFTCERQAMEANKEERRPSIKARIFDLLLGRGADVL